MILDKGITSPDVPPLSSLILFDEKRDGGRIRLVDLKKALDHQANMRKGNSQLKINDDIEGIETKNNKAN